MSSPSKSAQQLAQRLDGVSESATLKLNATVQAMKAQGVNVVNLTAGEPDFFVPDVAKKAAIAAIEANKSKYTPAPGIPELRERIASRTNAQQPSVAAKQPWKPSDVIVTNGGKQAIFNALMALVDPGDEVLIPSPYWLSYPEMTKLCGGRPVLLPTTQEQGFRLDPNTLAKALTPRSRILFLNSPSNPTGAMYSKAQLRALGQVLLESGQGVWVISDEIYDLITFGQVEFCSFLEAVPELRDRCVTVNGMSKSAAMTGWRVGWSVAPAALTQGMSTLQGQSTSGINSVAQWASIAALDLPTGSFKQQVDSYRHRRDLVLEILSSDPTIKVVAPDGAFYLFAGVGEHFNAGEDSIAFAQRLLEQAQVAVVPGTPFGAPEFIRISFATDEKSLREGCQRILKYLARK